MIRIKNDTKLPYLVMSSSSLPSQRAENNISAFNQSVQGLQKRISLLKE